MALGDSALLLHLQTEVLEAVARGEGLTAIGELLCRRAEGLAPGIKCSLLLVDDDDRLRHLAGPSLPQSYRLAVDGTPIGPRVGSCGTAAFRRQPVIVTDIRFDPLWDDYRHIAEEHGLRACWSSPIQCADGRVIATFAFYYSTPRGPNDIERRIVHTCVHLFAIAMESDAARASSHRLAYYDQLTGLPNRSHFAQLLDRHVADGRPFGLILADIDHLKRINYTLGHAYGDQLIAFVGQRIASAVPGVTACCMGGDEFAAIVPYCDTAEALEHTAGRILGAVSGLLRIDDHAIDPHLTAGGALFGPDGADAATLGQNADFALYHAKVTRRGGYMRFIPELRTAMVERVNTLRTVDAALAEGRLVAHYQPIVRIDTSEIVGMEALARLQMPDGRIATAGEFHTALRDPRIAYDLTGHLLTQIAGDIRRWLDKGLHIQHVGINVTMGDFQRGDLVERLVSAFETANTPLEHVILEVNESVFMAGSDQTVPNAVRTLREHGLLVALDDFGTGFASLTHLLSFPVDIIKIDKSFIDRLTSDASSAVIVGAIIDIARQLDMRVVAEGVESAAQQELLAKMGCKLGQGHLFSRACSVDEVTRLLSMFGQQPQILPDPGRKRA